VGAGVRHPPTHVRRVTRLLRASSQRDAATAGHAFRRVARAERLKIVYLGKPAGASWFYDDFYLCAHGNAGKRVWQFDPAILTVVEITPRIAAIERRHCGSIRSSVPLTVRFHFQRPELHWELGPYADGKYTVLLADGWETFEVPRKEALNIPNVTSLAVRVRYDSPEGWTTYSPEMALDFTRQSDFAWQR
jgi:hypothetical protein